jgi:hypothetical protein
MSDILVVALVVSCGHQMLVCEDLDTNSLSFKHMEQCRTGLEQLVSDYQQRAEPTRKVMGRCHYLLVEPPRTHRRVLRQTAGADRPR